jgi:hypothetical protein
MNAFWSYFWPAFGLGAIFGILAGSLAFRVRIVREPDRPHEPTLIARPRRKRYFLLAGGVVGSLVASALWHGPAGAADRLSAKIEQDARLTLVNYEAPEGMTARIHHGPLTRQLMLSGPGNDFQRGEAVRLLDQIPGVSEASWTRTAGIPLIIEGMVASLLGFLSGLLVAYLVELRRRYNSQWNW